MCSPCLVPGIQSVRSSRKHRGGWGAGPTSVDKDWVICWSLPSQCWCFKLQTPSEDLSSSPPAAAPPFCTGSKQLVPPQPMVAPPAHPISQRMLLHRIKTVCSSLALPLQQNPSSPLPAEQMVQLLWKERTTQQADPSAALAWTATRALFQTRLATNLQLNPLTHYPDQHNLQKSNSVGVGAFPQGRTAVLGQVHSLCSFSSTDDPPFLEETSLIFNAVLPKQIMQSLIPAELKT